MKKITVEMVTKGYYIGICENRNKIVPMIEAANFVRKELDNNMDLFKECINLGYDVNDNDEIVEFYFSGSWYPKEIELPEWQALDILFNYNCEWFDINDYDLGI